MSRQNEEPVLFNNEEVTLTSTDEYVSRKAQKLTIDVVSQSGTVATGLTFIVPTAVKELRLDHDAGLGWVLVDEATQTAYMEGENPAGDFMYCSGYRIN